VPRRRFALPAAICALLVLSTMAAFRMVRSNGFILFDDNQYVTENAHVSKGLTGDTIAWAFTTTDQGNWHPLTWLSHMLDVQLFGMNAGRHHLTSLLLHVLNVLLLFLLLFRMTGALWRSAIVAALFALHPLHVESVAWIAERKDVLSTLFWLLTTGAWLAYVKSSKAVPYALMLAFFALGLMAKPMLVTLPFTLLLFDYWPMQRIALPLREHSGEIKKILWEKAPLFVMAAASCVITVIAQRRWGAVQTLDQLPFAWRVENALRACVAYLGKAVWPSSLTVFYPHPRTGLFTASAAVAVLLLACATTLMVRLRRRAPHLLFGWLWYLGTLVPVIGLVQVGNQGMADRYTYIPLIGIFIAVVWGIAQGTKENRALRHAAAAAAVPALAALFAATCVQTGYWLDDGTLFRHALAVNPDNVVAHVTLGLDLYNAGRTEEAIVHYAEALRIDPRHPEANNNMGLALARTGRLDQAIERFNEALRVKPDSARTLDNLGLALGKSNRLPEAVACFQRAARLWPDSAAIRFHLGIALAGAHRLPEAVEQFREALKINPGFEQARAALEGVRGTQEPGR